MKLQPFFVSLAFFGFASMALTTLGCAQVEEPPKSCDGIVCSNHGTCVLGLVEDDKESCNCSDCACCKCDEGYQRSTSGLACLSTSVCQEVGQTCKSNDECCDGMCLKLFVGQTEGYCSKRDCGNNGDCQNRGTDGLPMCCVDMGGEFFMCLKNAGDCPCGKQEGTCGTPCGCEFFSACAPGMQCFGMGGSAFCSNECLTDADCQGCTDPNQPDEKYTCQSISGGQTYCQPISSGGCGWSQECVSPDVCIPFLNSAGTGFEPQCGKYGDLPTGAPCVDVADISSLPKEEQCAGIYCMKGRCSEVCTFAGDCQGDHMECGIVNFGIEGQDGVFPVGMCQYYCCGGPCDGNSSCPQGEFCDGYLSPGTYTFQQMCTKANCDPAQGKCTLPGGPCSQDLDPCLGELCLSSASAAVGFCSAFCVDSTFCPQSMYCGPLLMNETPEVIVGACMQHNPGSHRTCSSNKDCVAAGEVCGYIETAQRVEANHCYLSNQDGTHNSCTRASD
jgi:hypothetical protein